MDYGGIETIKGMRMAVWLKVKVRGRPLSVCDTKAPLQLQLRLLALYKCFMPLALPYSLDFSSASLIFELFGPSNFLKI